ncbi:hypothetical protein QUA56_07770 [Microcoleus sp. N3A4]|uniref:hypothetical protein n=1 Tax=Microcoleus sp. N3A4 TaxID=3055379 RepID=UPI002FD26C9D
MQQYLYGASPPVNLKEYPQSLSDAPGTQVSANKPTLIIVAFWRRELVLTAT